MMNSKMTSKKILPLLFSVLLIASLAPGVVAQSEDERIQDANLHVIQDSYVDGSVEVDHSGETPIYHAKGEQVRISVQGFDQEDVVDYGAESESGALQYDDRSDQYIFNPNGQNGTHKVYWSVQETVETENNGTTTNTSRITRYEAVMSMDMTQVETYESGEISQIREDAQSWENLEREIKSIAGNNADVEKELEAGLNYIRTVNNPVEMLSGQYTGLLLSLFITLGGLLILATFGVWHFWVSWGDKRKIHETESLEADRSKIDEQYDELIREKRRKALANMDWNDVFESDHVAAAFRRSFGETVLDGWMAIEELLLPETLLRDRLEAMAHCDYEVVVEREDDEIVSASVLGPSKPDPDEDDEVLPMSNWVEDEEIDELVELVEWDDPEIVAFDMPEANFDRDEMATVLESPNVERLMEEVDAQIGPGGDFGTRKEFLEYIVEFMADVRQHEFTDPRGETKPIRYLLNIFLQAAQLNSDRHKFPQAEYYAENLEMILLDQDIGAEVATYVEEVDHGKH